MEWNYKIKTCKVRTIELNDINIKHTRFLLLTSAIFINKRTFQGFSFRLKSERSTLVSWVGNGNSLHHVGSINFLSTFVFTFAFFEWHKTKSNFVVSYVGPQLLLREIKFDWCAALMRTALVIDVNSKWCMFLCSFAIKLLILLCGMQGL